VRLANSFILYIGGSAVLITLLAGIVFIYILFSFVKQKEIPLKEQETVVSVFYSLSKAETGMLSKYFEDYLKWIERNKNQKQFESELKGWVESHPNLQGAFTFSEKEQTLLLRKSSKQFYTPPVEIISDFYSKLPRQNLELPHPFLMGIKFKSDNPDLKNIKWALIKPLTDKNNKRIIAGCFLSSDFLKNILSSDLINDNEAGIAAIFSASKGEWFSYSVLGKDMGVTAQDIEPPVELLEMGVDFLNTKDNIPLIFNIKFSGKHFLASLTAIPALSSHHEQYFYLKVSNIPYQPIPVSLAGRGDKVIKNVILATFLIVCFGLILFFVQLLYVSQKIVLPLNEAVEFSNSLSRGDFSKRLQKMSRNDEIGKLIKSLNFMRDRLQNSIFKMKRSHEREKFARHDAENANNIKSSFLTRISQELRDPLNSIMGFSSIILKEVEEGSYDQDLKSKVLTVYKSSETLNQLVCSLLELSRLDSEEIELNIGLFEVPLFMREVKESLKNEIVEKNIQLENVYSSNAPNELATDKTVLAHIIEDLLSSIIKNASWGASVSLGYESNSNSVAFWVKEFRTHNNADESSSLAIQFNRYVNSQTEYSQVIGGTTMLNLLIAKNNTELLGGEFVANQTEEATSVFSITFNKNDILPQAVFETSSVHTASNMTKRRSLKKGDVLPEVTEENITRDIDRKRKLLMAEDNEANRMLIELMLKNSNYELECVFDGVQCVEVLKHQSFDALLLDLQMPNMDGYQVIDILRNNPDFENMPIIVLTAYLEEGDKEKLLEAGAQACILKPINIDELMQVLKKLT
jgi:CheY-like chemotaxis protein/signal transduction histidine kinase